MQLRATGFSTVIDPNYAEARRALALLIEPNTTFELRALPHGRSVVCRSIQEAITAIEGFQHAAGIYYTLNPCRADLDGPAKAADILRRRWLLVDIDPTRPADVSASDTEKAAAAMVAVKVIEDRTGVGWPAPVLIDSGNGYHLLWRVDLPNDKLAQQWLKQALARLGELESPEAHVDRAVHNAARISKLPGTWARKGSDTQERPHRLARLLQVPEALGVVTVEQIRELIGPEPKPAEKHVKLTATSGPGPDAYCRAALAGECAAVALEPDGGRNNRLNLAAFKLGGLLHLGTFSRSDVEAALTHAARRAGLTDKDIAQTIASGLDAGILEPREGPEREQPPPAPFLLDPDTTESTGKSGRTYKFPLIIRGADVQPKVVRWLWQDRIPFGFLTLMAGRTGVGKSFTTLDIAARQTVGGEIPNGGGECFQPGSVLIISEDPHDYVLAPRLLEAGADMARVSFMSWEAMGSFTLADSEMLDDTYHAAGSPKLVVIDPPTNFLGQKDEHRNAEVRGVLMGVSIWSMRHDVATVLITHCNKGIKKDMAALDRVIGSVAWASTSRIAHIFSPHPGERGQAVWIPLKNNLGPVADGLAFRIVTTDTFARVEWLGKVDFNADDAMGNVPKKSRGVVATEWLEERFRERREWLSDELKRAAAEAGISRNALFAPEVNALPIKKRKQTDATGETTWRWVAEDGWPPQKENRDS
jgi:hypothetical protein